MASLRPALLQVFSVGIECGTPFAGGPLGELARTEVTTNSSPSEPQLLCDGALRESSPIRFPHGFKQRFSLLASFLTTALVLIQLGRISCSESLGCRRLLLHAVESGGIRWRGLLRGWDVLQYAVRAELRRLDYIKGETDRPLGRRWEHLAGLPQHTRRRDRG